MSSIEERVKKIVVEQLGVKEEEVTANASFVDELGADSLDWGLSNLEKSRLLYFFFETINGICFPSPLFF